MADVRRFISWMESGLREYASGPSATAGLLIGDLHSRVERVLLAPDLTAEVAAEGLRARVDLIVTLRTPAGLPLAGDDGAHVRNLISAGVGLYSAADITAGLVAESFADLLDLENAVPLLPADLEGYALAVVYVPEADAEQVRLALAGAGAGAIGDYAGCAWSVTGTGEFTPGEGAEPAIGAVGDHEQVRERRLEMVVPLELIPAATAAIRAAHPYEEPAFSFVPTHPAPSRTGRGRRGRSAEPSTLSEICDLLSQYLPGEAIRVFGEGFVQDIAVVTQAGAGGVEMAIRGGADLLVTSDLTSAELARAHAADLCLVDLPHAAMLWFALPVLARRIAALTDGEIETIVTTTAAASWHKE